MAIDLTVIYPTQVGAATGAYPFGVPQNITTPGDGTGTPWEAAIVKDTQGFLQALLTTSSIVPSGTPDTALVSDYLDATRRTISVNQWDTNITYPIGAVVQASDNVTYVASVAQSGNDPAGGDATNWGGEFFMRRGAVSQYLAIRGGLLAPLADTGNPHIYRSLDNSASAPFERNGNLVYEATDDANTGHYFLVGLNQDVALKLLGNQSVVMIDDVFFGGILTTPSSAVFGGAFTVDGNGGTFHSSRATTSTTTHHRFYNPNGIVGSITTNGSATAYLTSSDPKLKTDFEPIEKADVFGQIVENYEDGTLGKFKWKADPDQKTTYGYNAHKMLDKNPFAGAERTGGWDKKIGDVLQAEIKKQREDKDGNKLKLEDGSPDMEIVQKEILVSPAGLDHSVQVPRLEAAIYHLIRANEALVARIENLEA